MNENSHSELQQIGTTDYLHKNKFIIQLALKIAMKGMSIEAIAGILEVQPVTVNNWVTRAAKQCELVNEELMKNLNVSRVEMDELWVIIKKSCSKNRK